MGITGSTGTLPHDLESFGDEQKRGHGDHQDQAFETGGITKFGVFQTEEATLVIQKSLLDLKALAVFSKRSEAGRFITDDLPLLWAVRGTAQSDMHRPESVSGEGDVVEAARFARRELDLADGADPLPVWSSKNQARFDADAKVPSADAEPAHQRRVAEAPIGQEPNITQPKKIQQTFGFSEDGQEVFGTDLSAGMLKDAGDERYRSSPVEDGHPDQTETSEQDAGVQRQRQGMRAPIPQGSGDEGAIHAARVDGWILQPPAAPTFGALGDRGLGVDVRQPGGNGNALGQHQAADHPRQRTGVADVVPQGGVEVGQDRLVQSGGVPGGMFGLHKQKVSPTGDAFS
ncbi:hypothetical protein SU48_08300 [Deinococcus puniceus]|uniref:Uncharacterized protein n=1 Tax=Deinococcus puniceus TaxID=1182568 RepID=A0A172T9Z6_9DEIO|nr:hypothetical protein SU48_08300 [Deinococcus puniceus]